MSVSSIASQKWPESASLENVLKAGAVISGADSTQKISNLKSLADVLHARLEQFDAHLLPSPYKRELLRPKLELNTAFASLYVLERVQAILSENETSAGTPAQTNVVPPMIGARDMGQMRTHLGLVFRWGTEHLLSCVLPTLPNRRSPRLPPGAQIIDLTAAYEYYTILSNLLGRLLKILFPDGPKGRTSQTFIAISILNKHFTDFLRPCICLGWLPNDLRGDLPPCTELPPFTQRLLNSVPPSQTIASLGNVLSTSTVLPQYVHRTCSHLLCAQLLRPYGVAGVFSALFGEDVSSEDAPLEKLDRVSKVLNVVPLNMSREAYYSAIVPRLIHLLTPAMAHNTPPSHKRAAAFSLSRMLQPTGPNPERDIRRLIVGWLLHNPFRPGFPSNTPPAGLTDSEAKAYSYSTQAFKIPPLLSVPTLSTILTNTEPAPELISTLLRPIVPQLYTLIEFLKQNKTADPSFRELVEGLLATWTAAATKEEAVDTLWKIVDGEGDGWESDEAGDPRVIAKSLGLPTLTLAQIADLQAGKLDSEDAEETNPLGLHPHPLHFAKFLKSFGREDVASDIYLRILDAHVKQDADDDPFRKLMLFKIIMQITSEVGESVSEGSPLKRPNVNHILTFIKLSLDRDEAFSGKPSLGALSLESLRIVPERDDERDEGGDSDDEDPAPGLEGVDKSEHLSVTAINLLLALLEENPDLSPKTEPLLNEIYSMLEPLANSSSDALRPRAREARMTLTARLASSTLSSSKRGSSGAEGAEENPQDKYQRALKLLQDPILPVRAHGLLLLRELVSPKAEPSTSSKKKKKKGKRAGSGGSDSRPSSAGGGGKSRSPVFQGAKINPPNIDPALVPAILSIFMQAAQDEDSYVFLNAVQGLAAMVDGFGKDVLKSLVEEYGKGLDGVSGSAMTQREVDVKVRVGEALGQVIKRCGGALGNYVDIIIPPVFAVTRGAHLPTTLRTSAVSLLATAVDTNSLAVTAYITDLIGTMVDLVQVEFVAASQPKPPAKIKKANAGEVKGGNAGAGVGPGGIGGDVKSGGKGKGEKGPGRTAKGKDKDKGDDVREDNGNSKSNSMDAQPTAPNPKFPPLRRAALHFLTLLIRALISRVYDDEGSHGVDFPGALAKRAGTVLQYVAGTDADEVVRVMAREAAEQLEQLRKALLGL